MHQSFPEVVTLQLTCTQALSITMICFQLFHLSNYQQQNWVTQISPNGKRPGSTKPAGIWKNPSSLIKSLNEAQTYQLEAWHSLIVMQHNGADLQYMSVLKERGWITLQLERILSEASTVSTFYTLKLFDYVIQSLAVGAALLLQ